MAAWNVAARICRLVCIAAPDVSTVKWYATPATFSGCLPGNPDSEGRADAVSIQARS